MRTKPVGTGPFKFVEFKRGDSIRLVRNPDYFKKDRPYLDEITVRDHRQPRHADAGVRDRRVRHHLSLRRQRAAAEGHQGAGAERDLRDDHDGHADQSDGQPRQPAVRQSRDPKGDVAGARPQGLQHHPDGRHGAAGRGDAAEARGRMGHAAGNGGVADRLWPGHRQEHRGSAGDHAEARLQRRQAAADQDPDPQPADLSRSRRDRRRPAQEDLHRRRTRHSRYAALVREAARRRITPSD